MCLKWSGFDVSHQNDFFGAEDEMAAAVLAFVAAGVGLAALALATAGEAKARHVVGGVLNLLQSEALGDDFSGVSEFDVTCP